MATRKRASTKKPSSSKGRSTKQRAAPKKRAVPARRGPTPRGVTSGHTMFQPLAGASSALGHALTLSPMRYASELVRDIPDFPKPGILFKDLTPLLADPKGLGLVIDALAGRFVGEHLDAIVAIESRGFIFGAALAQRLNLSFVPVRKPGKLPADVDSVTYSLEYGNAELQMHKDGLVDGARALVVDDLLATGGTASAAGELVRRRGAQVMAYVFVIELIGLSGRQALQPTPVFSLIQYE